LSAIKNYNNNIQEGDIFFTNKNNNNCEVNDDNKELESDNSNNKEKKYFKCPYNNCLKVYSSQYNLSVHIKTYHLKIKSFLCSLCPNKYFHKVSLKKHYMIEHKCKFEQLKQYLEEPKKISNMEEEIIEEAKKNLKDEGLYPNSINGNQNSEINEDISYGSEFSNENKKNEYSVDECEQNIFDEMNFYEGHLELLKAD
jgi:hypothetical protein